MVSRRFVRRFFLAGALIPVLAQGNDLLRGTVESLREAKTIQIDDTPLVSGRLTADFYARRNYQLAWIDSQQVKDLLQAVEDSRADGLIPADFHLDLLRTMAEPGSFQGLSAARRLAIDIKLSDALLRYTHQIRFGRLDPTLVNPVWNFRSATPADTLIRSMESIVSAQDTAGAIAAIKPQPFFYQRLKTIFANYQDPNFIKDLPPIPGGQNLAQGSRGSRVLLLRERLRLLDLTGDSEPENPELFDAQLRQLVIAFQKRFGLSSDGVVGPSTLATLNQPYDSDQAEKIRINLERMRWFYDDLPADYVFVDIAGFMVHLIRDQNLRWSTRAVVGTSDAQTPSFRDEMEHLVFNPTWTVPPSIQKKMRGVSSRYKVVDRRTGRTVRGGNVSDYRRYRVVQQAGPGNALGQVKFMFPNGHAIYLHDTQSKGLFTHTRRTYSHGCVRVHQPLELAEVILNEPGWNQSKIKRVIGTNRTRYVNLDAHLPVLLYYLTALTDESGNLTLRRDVYERDGALHQAIDGPPSPIRISFPKPTPIPLPQAVEAQEQNQPDGTPEQSPGQSTSPLGAPLKPTESDGEVSPYSAPRAVPQPATTVTLNAPYP